MADFVQTSITKTAVRELAAPIANVTAFATIVDGVITNNPWNCTAYTYGDVPQDPVAKSREAYTAYILFEDIEANTVGTLTARSVTVAAQVSRRQRRGVLCHLRPRPGTDLLLLGRCHPDQGGDLGRHRSGPGVIVVENEVLITGMFLGAGLLAYVVIPGLLVMWDRVLDHMGEEPLQGK